MNIKAVSLAAALIAAQAVSALAIEPPNPKRITQADKIYFGTRLDQDQFDKLQQVISHSMLSKKPCVKAAEIDKTLRFLKEITPIFQEAANRGGLSSYARNYSASLTQELLGTSKALNEILPHSRKACAASENAKGNN